jgi:hypothetical protein
MYKGLAELEWHSAVSECVDGGKAEVGLVWGFISLYFERIRRVMQFASTLPFRDGDFMSLYFEGIRRIIEHE